MRYNMASLEEIQMYSAGISLIEIMVVLAVVGILSFVGVNQVKDYTVKAHVTEMLTLLESQKLNVVEELLYKNDIAAVEFQPVQNMKSLKKVEFVQGKLIATADGKKLGTTHDLVL